MIKPRYAAADSIERIIEHNLFSNKETYYWLKKSSWKTEDQGLYLRLVYGTLENLLLIDAIIERISGRKMAALDSVAKKNLRISVYQLIFTDRIPDYAVINEAVEMTKKEKLNAAGFVNAILRKIQRELQQFGNSEVWLKKFIGNNKSLQYSHAPWILKKLHRAFSDEDVQAILQAHQKPPELTLRINTLKGNIESLVRRMDQDDISIKSIPFMPEAYIVLSSKDLITNTTSYSAGTFQIQSLASMLTVHWLDPQPGETIIDVAAAPGGKTTHISQRMNNKGQVIARDISATRLKQVQQHMNRLGCSNVSLETRDGTNVDIVFSRTADRVLVDAPCSSMGMIRKKPELKFNRNEKDFSELPALQLKLLESASDMVKPGGLLVYSTCTYFEEENKDVIHLFLQRNQAFSLAPMEDTGLEIHLDARQTNQGMVQLGPHIHPLLDGFFIAKLMKKPD